MQFRIPYGLELDPQGRLWIADWGNESVRLMHPDGRVETIAGSLPEGHTTGPARLAKFAGLMNIRRSPNGTLYVTSTDNQRLAIIAP